MRICSGATRLLLPTMIIIIAITLLVALSGCDGLPSIPSAPDNASGGGGEQDAPPSNALVLPMLYGSEKEAWINEVTAAFNNQQNISTAGRPIYVEATPIGSLESMRAIINGEEQPAIWSPASSIIFPLANNQWATSRSGEMLVEVSDAPSLVLSPVVIAMWRPMAEAMGWPDTPLGWGDIAAFAREDKTWADYGHPEWGPFKFGHTHPDYSNSGFITIMATAYAGAGGPRELTLEDMQNPQVSEFISDIESTVIHYGKSTGFFGRRMMEKGPNYLSAAVLYENLVMESYDRTRYPNLVMPIVAIYPREGTFWSDHPFAILPWARQDEEVRAAAETYRDFLLAMPQQERALHYGFRPSLGDVSIASAITPDKGVDPQQPVSVLRAPDAEVMEAARAAWGQNKKRVEVAVLIDTSGSMGADGRITRAKAGLRTFIEQLADADSLSVIAFSTEATTLSPLALVGTSRGEVLRRVDGLFAAGDTRLIDTTLEAYREMEQRPRGEHIRAIVVLSDGADTASTTSQTTLEQHVGADEEGYSIKIFAIAYGPETNEARNLLTAMAEVSGGKFYESGPDNIEQVYLDITRFF